VKTWAQAHLAGQVLGVGHLSQQVLDPPRPIELVVKGGVVSIDADVGGPGGVAGVGPAWRKRSEHTHLFVCLQSVSPPGTATHRPCTHNVAGGRDTCSPGATPAAMRPRPSAADRHGHGQQRARLALPPNPWAAAAFVPDAHVSRHMPARRARQQSARSVELAAASCPSPAVAGPGANPSQTSPHFQRQHMHLCSVKTCTWTASKHAPVHRLTHQL
jgi:hypothetical protein